MLFRSGDLPSNKLDGSLKNSIAEKCSRFSVFFIISRLKLHTKMFRNYQIFS